MSTYQNWQLSQAQAKSPYSGWSGTQLQTPQSVYDPATAPSTYQLDTPTYGGQAPAADYSGAAGAGIAAAGQLAGSLAGTAGGSAAMSTQAESSEASRASDAKMARLAMAQNQSQFQTSKVQGVYDMLLNAFRGQAQNRATQRDLQRGISSNMTNGVLTAYLG